MVEDLGRVFLTLFLYNAVIIRKENVYEKTGKRSNY